MAKLGGLIGVLAVLAATPLAMPVAAYAVDSMSPGDSPDLTAIRAKIAAEDYTGALTDLRDLAQDVQQPDVYNLLGFTQRKTGDYPTALAYYNRALELQPDFKEAHEYLGELYVQTGDTAKANEQLATLQKLCPSGCEELADLQEAIDTKVVR